jgi:integration host factor subunit alpha
LQNPFKDSILPVSSTNSIVLFDQIFLNGVKKMPTLTKEEIIAEIRGRTGFSRKKSRELVDLVLASLTDTLIKGEGVNIKGFGKFKVLSKKQRPGRNPNTGEKIIISKRKVVTFKASYRLKDDMNKKRGI